jgi:hypothetical protein
LAWGADTKASEGGRRSTNSRLSPALFRDLMIICLRMSSPASLSRVFHCAFWRAVRDNSHWQPASASWNGPSPVLQQWDKALSSSSCGYCLAAGMETAMAKDPGRSLLRRGLAPTVSPQDASCDAAVLTSFRLCTCLTKTRYATSPHAICRRSCRPLSSSAYRTPLHFHARLIQPPWGGTSDISRHPDVAEHTYFGAIRVRRRSRPARCHDAARTLFRFSDPRPQRRQEGFGLTRANMPLWPCYGAWTASRQSEHQAGHPDIDSGSYSGVTSLEAEPPQRAREHPPCSTGCNSPLSPLCVPPRGISNAAKARWCTMWRTPAD